MPNQFLSDEFGDIEDYFVTDYRLIDNFVGDTLWVWGSNEGNTLGINSTDVEIRTPVTTFAGGTNWKYISSGGYGTTAIKTDGTLWIWGNGGNGRLGINDSTNRGTPVTTFAGGNNWKQVANGGGYVLAIKTDGSLWGWGIQQDGALGNREQFGSVNTPITTFAGGNNWKSVSAGSPSAAIKTDGSLWVFGSNNNGQLGINENGGLKVTPVTTFAGGNDWKSVACGAEHVAAIKTDGSLWLWGRGDAGQLGNFANTNRNTPVTTFAGGNNWKSVTCGFQYTMAIKTDGTLWGWGSNSAGKLGANLTDADQRSTPITTFAGGNNWKSVSAGQSHTQAIKTDGTLWTWGITFDGRLGNNTTGFGFRFTPVTTFAGGNNWKQTSAANRHGSAIKSGLNVDLSFFPVGFVSDGLVLYLDAGNPASYPGNGTTWTDLTGNGNDGTLSSTNGPTFDNANGGSLVFDGTDDYVSFTYVQPAYGTTTSFSWNVWVYPTINNNGQLILGLRGTDLDFTKLTTNNFEYFPTALGGQMPLNVWQNVCVVKNQTSFLYYRNSALISSTTSTATKPSKPFYIGGDPSANEYSNSKIAQVSIYNRALSSTEIQQNFNFFKPRFGL